MKEEFHVIVYGASGFTGAQVCGQLYAKKNLKWAMAGRNLAKLKETLTKIQLVGGPLKDIPLLLANNESLAELASRTKVLVNCVGPYVVHGDPVVKACVESGCHYVDVTGEPSFFQSVIHKYHEKAQSKCIAIVSCCGFDSIPWDLGVLQATQGTSQRISPGVNSVLAYGKVNNAFPSVGTFASALQVMSLRNVAVTLSSIMSWVGHRDEPLHTRLISFFLQVPVYPHYSREFKKWAIPVPTLVDGMVVRRSFDMLKKADHNVPDVHYGQYMVIGNFIQLVLFLYIMCLIIPLLFTISLVPFGKGIATKVIRGVFGDGPSESLRKRCNVDIVVKAKDAYGLQIGKSHVRCPSDPMYGSTAKWVTECAMCLVEEKKIKGGVFTTATSNAMGFRLIDKLKEANLLIE